MSSPREDDCLFCKIVAGEIDAAVVDESESTLAFHDVAPQAPTHVLVIPRHHYPTAVSLAAAEPETTLELFAAAGRVADSEGLEHGYRLVFNTGQQAQQSVHHAHLHVIGGRDPTWPPG